MMGRLKPVDMTDNYSDSQRLIFIGGSPRSGTTLVQNILDSHPLILGGPEFLHLVDFIELRRKLHGSIAREWIDIICNRKDVDAQIVHWIKKLFLPLADKHQCEYYSEKSPDNILVFSELVELFPEAHFIHILRDPRAILSSMRQVKRRAKGKGLAPPSFTTNTATSIAYIKRCYDAGFRACRLIPDKVLTVVYEQLIANSETEAKRICAHIGIGFDDRMLRPGEKEHLGVKAITVKSNEIWYDSKTYSRNIGTRESEKWRNELPLYDQIRTTMAFAGHKELGQIAGYDFTVKGLAHGNRFPMQALIYLVAIGLLVGGAILSGLRRVPGFSWCKNGFQTVARLLRIRT
jgi:protein-tyrosine sulfotransferase